MHLFRNSGTSSVLHIKYALTSVSSLITDAYRTVFIQKSVSSRDDRSGGICTCGASRGQHGEPRFPALSEEIRTTL